MQDHLPEFCNDPTGPTKREIKKAPLLRVQGFVRVSRLCGFVGS